MKSAKLRASTKVHSELSCTGCAEITARVYPAAAHFCVKRAVFARSASPSALYSDMALAPSVARSSS